MLTPAPSYVAVRHVPLSRPAACLSQLGEGGSILHQLTEATTWERLVLTATDAKGIVSATSDAQAEARAEYWLGLLAEHGALSGWGDAADDDATEAAVQRAAAQSSVSGDGGSCGGSGSGSGGGSASASASAFGTTMLAEDDVDVAEDGNFDDCAVCGIGGLLICCEVRAVPVHAHAHMAQ